MSLTAGAGTRSIGLLSSSPSLVLVCGSLILWLLTFQTLPRMGFNLQDKEMGLWISYLMAINLPDASAINLILLVPDGYIPRLESKMRAKR